jgi:hypothetical protein
MLNPIHKNLLKNKKKNGNGNKDYINKLS